jgi:hypothetical protein
MKRRRENVPLPSSTAPEDNKRIHGRRWSARGILTKMFGKFRVRDLKRADIAALLDRIVDDHGARQADICLAIIRKLTHWYQARNDDYVSPAVRGMGRYKSADRKGGGAVAQGVHSPLGATTSLSVRSASGAVAKFRHICARTIVQAMA